MFAVRTALSNPIQLQKDINHILEKGQADRLLTDKYGNLEFIIEEGIANSIPEAAYRFASNTPGIHVTLTGTGNIGYLTENLKSIQKPPLPENTLKILHEVFGNVDCVNGQ